VSVAARWIRASVHANGTTVKKCECPGGTSGARLNRLFHIVAFGAALLAGATAAHGQSQTWATYAHDSATGRWGLSWGRTDRQTAINEALSRCASAGCRAGNVVLARCIAVATGTQRGPGFGTGNNAETAKAYALQFCARGPAGSTCEVDAVRCAN